MNTIYRDWNAKEGKTNFVIEKERKEKKCYPFTFYSLLTTRDKKVGTRMRSLARSSLPKARIILVRENSNLKAFLVAKIYLVSFFHRSLISKLFNHYFRLYRFLETGTRPFPGPFEFASKIPLHSIEIESIFAERRNLERNREPLVDSKDPFHERFISRLCDPFQNPLQLFQTPRFKSIRNGYSLYSESNNSIAKS